MSRSKPNPKHSNSSTRGWCKECINRLCVLVPSNWICWNPLKLRKIHWPTSPILITLAPMVTSKIYVVNYLSLFYNFRFYLISDSPPKSYSDYKKNILVFPYFKLYFACSWYKLMTSLKCQFVQETLSE